MNKCPEGWYQCPYDEGLWFKEKPKGIVDELHALVYDDQLRLIEEFCIWTIQQDEARREEKRQQRIETKRAYYAKNYEKRAAMWKARNTIDRSKMVVDLRIG